MTAPTASTFERQGWLASADATAGLALLHAPSRARWAPSRAADDDFDLLVHGRTADLARIAQRFGGDRRGTQPAQACLAAFRELGPRLPKELPGVYTLMVWERRARRLFIARDALGELPLFWAPRGPELLFSDVVTTLAHEPGVANAIDAAVVGAVLRGSWPRRDETFFAGVRRFPPGHAMIVEGQEPPRFTRTFDPLPADRDTIDWATEDEIASFEAKLGGVVDEAVNATATGIHLSGGLDSISLAAVAHGRPRPPLTALSLLYPDPEVAEEVTQRRVAERLAMPGLFLPFDEAVGDAGLVRASLDLSATLPSPLSNVYRPAFDELDRRAKAMGVDTLLTGVGGDEWLGVTPVLAADHLLHGRLGALAHMVRFSHRSYQSPWRDALRLIGWKYGARIVLREAALRALARAPALQQEMAAFQIERGRPGWLLPDPSLRRRVSARRAEDTMVSLGPPFYLTDARHQLAHPGNYIEYEEMYEAGRRLDLVTISPYLDPRIVELALRIPPERLMAQDRGKALVRAIVEKRLPGMGFEAQRKGLGTPFFLRRMERQAPAAWAALGEMRALDALGIVDARRLQAERAALFAVGTMTSWLKVWDILNFETWARAHLEGRSA